MIPKERLKQVKLVIFDLDGTLLDDKGEIGRDTVDLVKKLDNYGVQFSFASGRLHSALTDYAAELKIHTPLISLDGCLIKSYPAGTTIYQSVMPVKHVLKTIALAEKFLVKFALCHADAIYFTEHNSLVADLIDKFGAKYEEVHSYTNLVDKTLEIVLVSEFKDYIKEIEKRLSFPYSLGLTTTYSKSYQNPGMYLLEIRKQGSSKATGLKKLASHLKIGISQTAVIGDWYNDKSLFDTKAVKVAVANAVPEIKFLSDYVTQRSNDEDGVAEFLEMLYKAKVD